MTAALIVIGLGSFCAGFLVALGFVGLLVCLKRIVPE